MDNDRLRKLSETCENLNRQSIELNNKFMTIERKLNDMKLGVSGWSDKLIGLNQKNNFAYKFGFCRIGKEREEWRLVCRKINLNQKENEKERVSYGLLVPITAMSRSVRLEASQLVDEVIDSLISRSQTYLNDIDNAIGELDKTDGRL